MNSVDLAAARTLLLAYLSNSDNDLIADYASLNLTQLCDTRRVEDFDEICNVGNSFAETYDFSDDMITAIREKFEEADELTWKTFEATMDSSVGEFSNQGAISLFLAVVNSIQVPVEELDDLLDLAAWYASCRLSPLVKSEGGWGRFSRRLTDPDMPDEEPIPEQTPEQIPERAPVITSTSVTIEPSKLETSAQKPELKSVEMGSMVILTEKEEELEKPEPVSEETTPEPEVTPVQSFNSLLTATPNLEEAASLDAFGDETSEEHSEDVNQSEDVEIKSDEGQDHFSNWNEQHFREHSEPISEQSSSERLSSSPVLVSPTGTGTPVYIASQPESIDLDSNHSSLDASLINDLIENLKEDGHSDTVPSDTVSDFSACHLSPMTHSGDVTDEEELAFHRSNTVETIKPNGSLVHGAPSSGSIAIRSSTDHLTSHDEGGVTLHVDEHRFNSMLTLSELDTLAELTVNACRVSPVSFSDSDPGSGVGKGDASVQRNAPSPEPNSGDFIGGLLSGRFLVPVAICAFILIQSRFKITI